MLRKWLGPVLAGAVAIAAVTARPAHADDDASAAHERCATRLSIAFLGKSATPEQLAAANPQDAVDGLLADPSFVERFSRFVNAKMNPEPGMLPGDDASYTLSKFLLTTNGTEAAKPWKDMFVGPYRVTDTVAPDPNGLGYFRSEPWMVRYAGNELEGLRIAAAYRIMQNTTGLKLEATTSVDGKPQNAKGREDGACRGCHYDGWYALDLVARVLSRKGGTEKKIDFLPSKDGPQTILGGKTIRDDKGLVEALVASEDFKVNTCRLAFEFLYGRAETQCEGPVFDKCIDAFTGTGTMQSALGAIAKDPGFCQ